MFGSKPNGQTFIQQLAELTKETEGKPPKTVHTTLEKLLNRSAGFEGNSIDELARYLTRSNRKKEVSKQKAVGKLRPASKALTAETIKALEASEADETLFSEVLGRTEKTCGAATLKDVAARYAAIVKPATKAAAIKAIKSARSSRIRSQLKREQSGQATPW